jgi:hypothetical protein
MLWLLEREYVYPKVGPLVYYTYYWGIFLAWGLAVTAYSAARAADVH